jgi:hypothetical protein
MGGTVLLQDVPSRGYGLPAAVSAILIDKNILELED